MTTRDADAGPDPGTLAGMFQDPGLRNYLFAGFGGLAMAFVVLFSRGTDLGALLLVLIGATGMVLRWPAAPQFFLLILAYFLVFPGGIPDASEMAREYDAGHFHIDDLLLVAAVVVYLACHYRVFGMTARAVPPELRPGRRKAAPNRRPAALIRPGEIVRLLYVVGGVVVAGQLVWLFLTTVEVDALADFPLRVATSRSETSPVLTRFLLLSGLLFFGTLLARLVFGYWRLRVMSAAEGGMIVQDAGWDETRRERVRVEGWRFWGRQKAAARAAKAAGARPGGEQ